MNTIRSLKVRQGLSWQKRSVSGAVLAGIVVVACELISWAGLFLVDADFTIQKLRLRQQAIAEGVRVSEGANEAFHPYLG